MAEPKEGALVAQQPGFMGLIEQALTLPAAEGLNKVELIERLYALKRQDDDEQARRYFFEQLNACQKKMPRVEKNGLIDPQGARVPYAKLEDLDRAIRPIYESFGFSVHFDAPMTLDGGKIRFTAKFSCGGHTEPTEITAAPNTGDVGRLKTSPVQAVKKTITEARRALLELFFNIITVGADDPTLTEPVTQDQATAIRDRLNALPQSRAGFLASKLCQMHRVATLEDLRAGQLDAVLKDVADTEKRLRK